MKKLLIFFCGFIAFAGLTLSMTISPVEAQTPEETPTPTPTKNPFVDPLFYSVKLEGIPDDITGTGTDAQTIAENIPLCPGGDRAAGLFLYIGQSTVQRSLYGGHIRPTFYASRVPGGEVTSWQGMSIGDGTKTNLMEGYSGRWQSTAPTAVINGIAYQMEPVIRDLFRDYGDFNVKLTASIATDKGVFYDDPGPDVLSKFSIAPNAINSYTLEGVELHAVCYGTHNPEPETGCVNSKMHRRVDLLETGTVVSGSTTAQHVIADDGQSWYMFDFTVEAPLPGQLAQGSNPGWLNIMLDDPDNLRSTGELTDVPIWDATINGSHFSIYAEGGRGSGNKVGIEGGAQTITVRLRTNIPGRMALPGEKMKIASLTALLPFGDGCEYNMLGDGGMEYFPRSDRWLPRTEIWDDFGRVNSVWSGTIASWMNGAPSCGNGHQIVGYWVKSALPNWTTRQAAPIYQAFEWAGGDLYWKFRARGDEAYVTIKDTAGSVIAVLYSGPLKGRNTWELFTGVVPDLEEGIYQIELAYRENYNTKFIDFLAFDDVAIGTRPSYLDCDVYYDEPPEEEVEPTPTARPSGTVTVTRTPTKYSTVTPYPTNTITLVPTWTTTARPTKTPTPGPSPTPWWYKTSTSTVTPTQTRPPYGTPGGPQGPYTATPDPNNPPDPDDTPTPSPTDDGWHGGDMPPGNTDHPGGEGPGMNPDAGDCTRPTNPWSIAWWVDYEFCRLFYAVSWQPRHTEQLVAVPTMFGTYEPFRSAGEVINSINVVQTEVAAYDWNTGIEGLDNQVPNPYAFRPGPDSPYNGGKIDLSSNKGPNYSRYCKVRITDVTGKLLAEGMCFIYNILLDKGIMIWYQVIVNGISIVFIIKCFVRFFMPDRVTVVYDASKQEE